MQHRYLSVILLFLLFFGATSCLEEQFEFDKFVPSEWESEWAIPVVNSDLGIEDILTDSIEHVQEDPDGLVTLVYEAKNLLSVSAQENINLPNQSVGYYEEFTIEDIFPGDSATYTYDNELYFEPDTIGQRLDSVYLDAGELNILFETDLNKEEASAVVTLPTVLEQETRQPLLFPVALSSFGTSADTIVNLTNYLILFTGEEENTLPVELEITVHGDNNPNNSPYHFELDINFSALDYEMIFGYLSTYEYQLDDTIRINIFNNALAGNFIFTEESSRLNLNVRNSYGMPLTLNVDNFMALGQNEQVAIDVNGPQQPDIIEVNFPGYDQIGEIVTTSVNTENSTIAEGLNVAPRRFAIAMTGLSNPPGSNVENNFVIDTSRFNIDLNLEMDLFGSVNDFRLSDTFSVDIPDDGMIAGLEFKINALNDFPVDVKTQVVFYDVDTTIEQEIVFVPLDSLFMDEELLIGGAAAGGPPDYRTTQPFEENTSVEVDENKLDNIVDAEHMIIYATLSTTGVEDVKIYADYRLQIQIGALAKVKL